jgi:hypothetical protein
LTSVQIVSICHQPTIGRSTGPHISAVERAGVDALKEGQRVSFDILAAQRTGKSAADNLRAAQRAVQADPCRAGCTGRASGFKIPHTDG